MHRKAASNCAVVELILTPWTKNYRTPFVAAVSMEPRYIEITVSDTAFNPLV